MAYTCIPTISNCIVCNKSFNLLCYNAVWTFIYYYYWKCLGLCPRIVVRACCRMQQLSYGFHLFSNHPMQIWVTSPWEYLWGEIFLMLTRLKNWPFCISGFPLHLYQIERLRSCSWRCQKVVSVFIPMVVKHPQTAALWLLTCICRADISIIWS